MDLPRFDTELRTLANADGVRPFVCDGSPLTCPIFIVGTNPATEVPFWDFWDSTSGFRKREWLDAYERARLARDKSAQSPTRRRLERIVAAASAARCLETNIFAAPSARAADFTAGERQTRIFWFLLETVRPRVMHVHGEEAREYVRRTYGASLVPGTWAVVETEAGPVDVLATHHLAYQCSYARAEETGRLLAAGARAAGG